MPKIERVHANFKLAYNKVDSNHKKDFPVAFIDDLVNISMRKYVEYVYKTFESIQQKTDMLQVLVKTENVTLPAPSMVGKWFKYEIPLSDLSNTYGHLLRSHYEDASCACLYNVDIVQEDDINILLNNPYKQPNDQWRRILGNISDSTLVIYTETAKATLSITYIKEPTKVFFGGYNTLEFIRGDLSSPQSSTAPIDPEIPDLYLDTLVDIMVAEVSGNLGDNNQYNLRKEKISQIV
jgi:hypothetical protein